MMIDHLTLPHQINLLLVRGLNTVGAGGLAGQCLEIRLFWDMFGLLMT